MSWADAVATIGITLCAILGGYLKVLPDKLVAALVMAAAGYLTARAALKARDKRKQGNDDAAARQISAEDHRRERDDGAPEEEQEHQTSGVIDIAPQMSGRVQVFADGRVVIGPPDEHGPFDEPADDRTPTDAKRPASLDGDGGKAA